MDPRRRRASLRGFWSLDFRLKPAESDGSSLGQEPNVIQNPKSKIQNDEVLDLLTSLVDNSLVQFEPGASQARYRMLETVRLYASERLATSGGSVAAREKHAAFFLQVADTIGTEFARNRQVALFEPLHLEIDNLRAAMQWYLAQKDTASSALILARSMRWFLHKGGWFREARQYLLEALALDEGAAPTNVRADALIAAGSLASEQGDYAEARALYVAGLEMYDVLGDTHGRAAALQYLGWLARFVGDLETARTNIEQSILAFEECGDLQRLADALIRLGNVEEDAGDRDTARMIYERSLRLPEQQQDLPAVSYALSRLADASLDQKDYASVRRFCERRIRIDRELQDYGGVALSLTALASAALGEGDHAGCVAHLEECLAVLPRSHDRGNAAWALHCAADCFLALWDLARAHALYCQSLAIWLEIGHKRGLINAVEAAAGLAVMLGEYGCSARLFGAAEGLREAISAPILDEARPEYDRRVAAVRAGITAERFAQAWLEGRAMTAEAAVQLFVNGVHARIGASVSTK